MTTTSILVLKQTSPPLFFLHRRHTFRPPCQQSLKKSDELSFLRLWRCRSARCIDQHSFELLCSILQQEEESNGERRDISRELGSPSPPGPEPSLSACVSPHHSLFFCSPSLSHPIPDIFPPLSYVCKRSHGNCRTACLATGFILFFG